MNDSTTIQDSSESAAQAPQFLCPPPTTVSEILERLDIETAKRVHAEELLRETEQHFRQLSERAGKFLWISDPQMNELIYISPGYEEGWARTREDIYSSAEHWTNVFKRSGRTTVLPEAPGSEQVYQVAGPDGAVRWIRDRMFPIRDDAGNVQRILGIAEDVTEAKLIHDSLARTAARTKA